MSSFNVLTRGQSNAYVFQDKGAWKMEQTLNADGDHAKALGDYNNDDGAATIFSATRFMDWDVNGEQKSMLNYIDDLSAADKATPTVINWMHNEYDQQGSFSTAEWVAEVRKDAALVREAFGQDASTTPYVFTAIKYPYGNNFDAIRDGIDQLVADKSFNAHWGADLQDLKMDGDGFVGSSHMGAGDAQLAGVRLAAVFDQVMSGATTQPIATPAPTYGGWTETFDDGDWGRFDHAWGNVSTNAADGTMTLVGNQSGIMEKPTDASAGDGYGYRSVTANITGDIGAAIVMWPGDDVWPGQEIDIGEINGARDGQYAAVHWRGEDGSDQYTTFDIGDHRGKMVEYGINWTPGKLEFMVDGVVKATTTEHVPVDYANGGMDDTLGWLSGIPSWGDGNGKIVVTEASFTPYGAPSVPNVPSQPTPQPGIPTAPGHVETGATGSDTLQVWVSAEKYGTDAQFTVSVDGVQHGEVHTVTHEYGKSAQAFDVKGDWDAGVHTVKIDFLNDEWKPEVGGDKNLYVNGALENGVAINGAEQMIYDGNKDGTFKFTDTTPLVKAPVETLAPTPTPTPPVEAPVETAPVVPAPAQGELVGTSGSDTMMLNNVFNFNVDAGDGADFVKLGANHGDVEITMRSGQAGGDVVTGFNADAGDHLTFVGYGAGAELDALGDGLFQISGGAYGHDEMFTLVGVSALAVDEYAFA